ncbi:serine/arginine repetitive matrix protein 1-like isoform X2 [Dermacentor albipictus]|uniref:serine/arginine repetitive matrix protein 1-like isoform X2 n=1 Tax=Dermacentor albipictus TaxID=60249 RepID=UPI0038FC7BC3
MAPPGRQRSRRRPALVGLIESRKQQTCEAAARQVAVARLTRPAERSFRNQRESLHATRGESAAPAPLSRRLERDLLSLVCEKRDAGRATSATQRLSPSSPPSPQRPRKKGSSRERRRGSRVERRRKVSELRRGRSPSSSPSLSSSDRSREGRLRRPRRRSRRSGSSDARSPEVRAPPAAPMVRASFRRSARQLTPPAVRSGEVIGSGGSLPGCRQSKEKREQHILTQSLLQLHNSLDAKRRKVPWGKSMLADVRSYCQKIARRAQSEHPPLEEKLSPSPQQEAMVEEEEAVPDPNFVVDEEPMEDEEIVVVLSSESQTASPASSLLPDSPRKQQPPSPPWCEGDEGDRRLGRGPEEGEEVEEAADVVSVEPWPPGDRRHVALPGTSASSFLVPWNRLAAAQAGPRLAAVPAPCVSSSSSCSSRRREAVAVPEPGAAPWGRGTALLPTPGSTAAARPLHHAFSWRAETHPPMTPVRARPSASSVSGPSPWQALVPMSTTPMFPGTLQAPPPPRPPPATWQRPAEEFITEMTPAEWRPARRCFSPSADHVERVPRLYQQRLYAPTPRPMHADRGDHQSVGRHRMEGAWRFPGWRMF